MREFEKIPRPSSSSAIAKNYLESSSIEKNCLRSSSTWTSGVHRDKESLPNGPKPHSLTRFQPGHQPENWRTLQEEEATLGSVCISSGTSGLCSCRNFGTCIITLMHSSGSVRRDGLRLRSSLSKGVAAPNRSLLRQQQMRRRCGVFAMRSLERSPNPACPCFFIQKGSAGPAHLQDRRHDSVFQHQDSDPDSLV